MHTELIIFISYERETRARKRYVYGLLQCDEKLVIEKDKFVSFLT